MKALLYTSTLLLAFAPTLLSQTLTLDPPPQEPPPQVSFQKLSSRLAIIEGDHSLGSGFVATLSGKPVLFTNSHVLSGNTKIQAKLLNGTPLTLSSLSVADGYDVSVFQQTSVPEGLEILKDVDANVSIGDDVVVLGNSLGAGVVTELKGKVTGIGPELIEIDSKFVSGNSGSPVIHVKTGKIIGIATFATVRKLEGFGEDSKFNSVERRFAYRLDNVPAWYDISWAAFSRESAVIGQLQDRTEDAWKLAVDIAENGRVTNWREHTRKNNHFVNILNHWQKVVARGSRTSKAQMLQEKKRLLVEVVMRLRSDLSSIKPNQFSAFNRKLYEKILSDRKELTSYFQKLEDQLTNDPDLRTR